MAPAVMPPGHAGQPGGAPRRRRDRRTGERYYEHRAVAAWKLGRPLTADEVVCHLNGDAGDNHPDNLKVFPSRRAYMLFLHYRAREATGIRHLFRLEEVLELEREPQTS